MAPAVQNKSRDIAAGVKSGRAKHCRELLPDLALIVAKRRGQHLSASAMALLLGGQARVRIQNLDREHDGRVRPEGRRSRAREGNFANLNVISNAFDPLASRDAPFVKETPV